MLRLEELYEAKPDQDVANKFTKDMKTMMNGILDLERRGSLPDLEKASTVKVLLRLTMKEDIFDGKLLGNAQVWLSSLEGSRKRTGRARVEDHSSPVKSKASKSK